MTTKKRLKNTRRRVSRKSPQYDIDEKTYIHGKNCENAVEKLGNIIKYVKEISLRENIKPFIYWPTMYNVIMLDTNYMQRFEKDILPRFFKHNKFSSLNRNLNMYEFSVVRNIDEDVIIMRHGNVTKFDDLYNRDKVVRFLNKKKIITPVTSSNFTTIFRNFIRNCGGNIRPFHQQIKKMSRNRRRVVDDDIDAVCRILKSFKVNPDESSDDDNMQMSDDSSDETYHDLHAPNEDLTSFTDKTSVGTQTDPYTPKIETICVTDNPPKYPEISAPIECPDIMESFKVNHDVCSDFNPYEPISDFDGTSFRF